MANISSPLPDFGFPGEFDTIRFQEVGGPMTFRVACEDAAIDLLLSPNEKQCVVVEDFAPVLRDFTADGMPRACSLEWDGGTQAFTVLPCRHDIIGTAADFCAAHFLTSQEGAKSTYSNAGEWLTLFVPDGEERPPFSVVLTWWDVAQRAFYTSELSEAQAGGVTEVGAGIFRFDASPQRLASPREGSELHSFTVTAGKCSQAYVLRPCTDAVPLTLAFRNAFGQWDSFHFFGELKQELSPTRSAASFSGRTRNYRVQEVPEFTAQTGLLRPGEVSLLADIVGTKEVRLRTMGGVEVSIVDNDFKFSRSHYEPQQGSVSFRYAGRTAARWPALPVRTFDDTFDETYL